MVLYCLCDALEAWNGVLDCLLVFGDWRIFLLGILIILFTLPYFLASSPSLSIFSDSFTSDGVERRFTITISSFFIFSFFSFSSFHEPVFLSFFFSFLSGYNCYWGSLSRDTGQFLFFPFLSFQAKPR